MEWMRSLVRRFRASVGGSLAREEIDLADRCTHQPVGACDECRDEDFDARIW